MDKRKHIQIGDRYGSLTVLGKADDHVSESGRHRKMSLCLCDCGNTITTYNEFLTSGRTKSCGCYRRIVASDKATTHGQSNTHLYGVWLSMKRRCDCRSAGHYDDYGGRGISVCDEWANSYESFSNWAITNGYQPGLSIDRIDVNSGYSPQNCRWATAEMQANNRRSNHLITHNGETHNIKEWSNIIGVSYKTLHNRIRSGWSASKALETPVI